MDFIPPPHITGIVLRRELFMVITAGTEEEQLQKPTTPEMYIQAQMYCFMTDVKIYESVF